MEAHLWPTRINSVTTIPQARTQVAYFPPKGVLLDILDCNRHRLQKNPRAHTPTTDHKLVSLTSFALPFILMPQLHKWGWKVMHNVFLWQFFMLLTNRNPDMHSTCLGRELLLPIAVKKDWELILIKTVSVTGDSLQLTKGSSGSVSHNREGGPYRFTPGQPNLCTLLS